MQPENEKGDSSKSGSQGNGDSLGSSPKKALPWFAATSRSRAGMGADGRRTTRLKNQMELLKIAQKRVELSKARLGERMDQIALAQLSRPWWRSWSLATLGAFVASLAPVTVGVSGYFNKQAELQLLAAKQGHELQMAEQRQKHDIDLARQKQDEDIRGRYLDRAADLGQTLRTLRLLKETSQEEAIRSWASEELSQAQLQKEEFDRGRKEAKERADKSYRRLEQLLESSAPADQTKVALEVAKVDRAAELSSPRILMAEEQEVCSQIRSLTLGGASMVDALAVLKINVPQNETADSLMKKICVGGK